VVTWEGRLLAHLNNNKRYPREARFNRQEGVVQVRFVIDRTGTLYEKELVKGSGFPALDQEALDMLERASPMPRPPEDAVGSTFEFVVPVEFFIR
jgi:protein TonB